jgi:hypothetical protein
MKEYFVHVKDQSTEELRKVLYADTSHSHEARALAGKDPKSLA